MGEGPKLPLTRSDPLGGLGTWVEGPAMLLLLLLGAPNMFLEPDGPEVDAASSSPSIVVSPQGSWHSCRRRPWGPHGVLPRKFLFLELILHLVASRSARHAYRQLAPSLRWLCVAVGTLPWRRELVSFLGGSLAVNATMLMGHCVVLSVAVVML